MSESCLGVLRPANPSFSFSPGKVTVYATNTPNGHKPVILLEELGIDYDVVYLPLAGEQHDPRFVRLSPAGKIPALVDARGPEPLSLFESGAMLWYLATHEARFVPDEARARAQTHAWLMYQMSTVGPYLGQRVHFLLDAPERVPYAVQRYGKIAREIYRVLDTRLGEHEYLDGHGFSVADIATWPWVRRPEVFEVDTSEFPHLSRWVEVVGRRPAVGRAMSLFDQPRPAL